MEYRTAKIWIRCHCIFRQLKRTVRLSVGSVRYSDGCHYAVYRGFTWYYGIRIFKEKRLMHLLTAVSISALCSRMKFCLLHLHAAIAYHFYILPSSASKDNIFGTIPVRNLARSFFIICCVENCLAV